MKKALINNKPYNLILLFFMFFMLGFRFNMFITDYLHNKSDCMVYIPDSKMIDNRCKDLGFDNGWLSSTSCKENQIMCHKQIGELDKYQCIYWDFTPK